MTATATSTGVLDYLRSSLPRSILLKLYADEARGRFVCRAILQTLSQVSQQVVMRLLACGATFPKASIQVWTKNVDLDYLKDLYTWGILTEAERDVTMSPEFCKGLNTSITSLDSSPWTPLTSGQLQAAAAEHEEVYKAVTPEDLERYTQSQWDAVLHFLVGTPNYEQEPPPAVVHFLLQTGLMQTDPDYMGSQDDAPLVITSKGYDFMLQDTHQQVWHFVSQYLQSLEGHKKHQELLQEALLFLICLSYCRLGEAYAASSLTKDGRGLMKDLALFGLLYVQKIGKASIFYPTRVALQLVQETSSQNSMWSLSSKTLDAALAHPRPRDSSHLAIIVQTNFQLCAYTTSELHVSMLALFCEVSTIRRLPNIVFMLITRDSVKSAFALGIQASQIVRFLEKHAHPKLRMSGTSPVPQNIRDQIWLWDRERRRVLWTEVYTHQCLMAGEFEAVMQYAMDKNVHAWSSKAANQILVDYAQSEKVEGFAQKWRAKTVARQAQG